MVVTYNQTAGNGREGVGADGARFLEIKAISGLSGFFLPV